MNGQRYNLSGGRGPCFVKTWAVALMIIVGSLTPATAYVLQLTGGDPGEGFSPEPILMYAYDTSETKTTTNTIQGVPFLPYHLTDTIPNITDTWTLGYTLAAPALGASSNDDAMEDMLKDFWYSDPNVPQTLTLGGLTSGQKYRVDLFIYKQDGPSGGTFDFNGAQANSFTATMGVPYILTEEVAANGSGQIVVGMTSTAYSVLNGFAVSIPEPSAGLLLGLGGLLVWRRRTA